MGDEGGVRRRPDERRGECFEVFGVVKKRRIVPSETWLKDGKGRLRHELGDGDRRPCC